MEAHLAKTLEKYFDHIDGHEDNRTFTPGESAYLNYNSLLYSIIINKIENDGKYLL